MAIIMGENTERLVFYIIRTSSISYISSILQKYLSTFCVLFNILEAEILEAWENTGFGISTQPFVPELISRRSARAFIVHKRRTFAAKPALHTQNTHPRQLSPRPN
jgi:hypothetical protein